MMSNDAWDRLVAEKTIKELEASILKTNGYWFKANRKVEKLQAVVDRLADLNYDWYDPTIKRHPGWGYDGEVESDMIEEMQKYARQHATKEDNGK